MKFKKITKAESKRESEPKGVTWWLCPKCNAAYKQRQRQHTCLVCWNYGGFIKANMPPNLYEIINLAVGKEDEATATKT